MVWSTFFKEGGWGMFPTTIFGSLLLLAALLYALKPERRFVPLVLTFGAITMFSGLLGFSVGAITTFHAVAMEVTGLEKQHAITLLGLAESANNIVLALIGLVMASLVASVGAVRIARRPA
jgi:hypothetical protein